MTNPHTLHIHEAAHAVLSIRLGLPVQEVSLGYTDATFATLAGGTEESRIARAAVLLAGFLAQEHAANLAGETWPAVMRDGSPASPADLDTASLMLKASESDFTRAFEALYTPYGNQPPDPAHVAKAMEATRGLIAAHWATIEAVAHQFQARGVLAREEPGDLTKDIRWSPFELS